jgi:membrane protease YdiL (CAAX protease family)
VTAAIGGRAAARDLARRSLRWRVAPRWYAIALAAPPAILLASVTALHGLAPLHRLVQNWPLQLTSFLPTLLIMLVLYNLVEELGFTGFLFARLQDRHGSIRAALANVKPAPRSRRAVSRQLAHGCRTSPSTGHQRERLP